MARTTAPKVDEPEPKRGRPTDYQPTMCDRVLECGREGMSKAEIAADLECSRQTLDNWAEAHPDFLEALQRAGELSLAWWEKQARTNLVTSGFQAGLWKQAMSGRFPAEPYRERQEVSGRLDGNHTHTVGAAGLQEALNWIAGALGEPGEAAD